MTRNDLHSTLHASRRGMFSSKIIVLFWRPMQLRNCQSKNLNNKTSIMQHVRPASVKHELFGKREKKSKKNKITKQKVMQKKSFNLRNRPQD